MRYRAVIKQQAISNAKISIVDKYFKTHLYDLDIISLHYLNQLRSFLCFNGIENTNYFGFLLYMWLVFRKNFIYEKNRAKKTFPGCRYAGPDFNISSVSQCKICIK